MDWKKIVATVAPTLASALGTPIAGMAVQAGLAAFGITTGDEKDLEAAIRGATPADMLALKKADHDFASHMRELDIDLERIMAGDRDSARKMQTDVRSVIPGALAVSVTFGFFGILGFMLTHPIPETGRDALMIMLGSLGTAWATIIAFYFGSSSGSAAKDQTIKDMTADKK